MILASLLLAGMPPAAAPPCSPGLIAELPVKMERLRPMVPVRINGQPVDMLLDTGAFTTIIWRPAMVRLGLKEEKPERGFFSEAGIEGVGGFAHSSIATARTLTLDQASIPNVRLLVGDVSGMGQDAGVIGRGILGLGNILFDFAGGQVRLIESKGCAKDWVPPWLANRSGLSMLPLEQRNEQAELVGTVLVNGVPMRALFDTGSGRSILTTKAAIRAGIRVDDPANLPGGTIRGVGQRLSTSTIASVASLKIGDEEIRRTRIRFGDIVAFGFDIIVGADFFRSHQIYAALKARKLYFLYGSGPVFDLTADAGAGASGL